jgi:hypothetical protein
MTESSGSRSADRQGKQETNESPPAKNAGQMGFLKVLLLALEARLASVDLFSGRPGTRAVVESS